MRVRGYVDMLVCVNVCVRVHVRGGIRHISACV